MPEKPFYRFACENCGAPLKRGDEPGEYICEYCQATYLHSGEEIRRVSKPVRPKPISPEPLPVSPTPSRSIPSKPKSSRAMLWITVGGVLLGCLLVSLMLGLFSGGSSLIAASQVEPKPEMLSQLPQSIPGGNPLYFADWEILLEKGFTVDDNNLMFTIQVKNWSDETRIFRFSPTRLEVFDDLGNAYPLRDSCAGAFYEGGQISFDPGESQILESRTRWCSGTDDLPAFYGVIPVGAKKLYFKMVDFGPVSELYWVIDL